MVSEMANKPEALMIHSCGGTDDNGIGTDPTKILEAIEASSECEHIYLIGDIGSGLISLDMALDLVMHDELRAKCYPLNVPLVEGAFVVGVQSMVDGSPEAIEAQLKELIQGFI